MSPSPKWCAQKKRSVEFKAPAYRFAEDADAVWLCVETAAGPRCGKCTRGVFRDGGHCLVCGAEHWTGRVYTKPVRRSDRGEP